jgi:hypothetical protein
MTYDVHTYIEHVKDARLAGIFYWSQTRHIFGQRPSYTKRETRPIEITSSKMGNSTRVSVQVEYIQHDIYFGHKSGNSG